MASAVGICAHCVSGLKLPGDPTGAFHDGAYFRSAQSTTSARAVVLLTDAFGLPYQNCKLLADIYSQRLGCDVWVPDMFDGTPPIPLGTAFEDLPQTPGGKVPLSTKLKLLWTVITNLPGLVLWNRASQIDARVDTFLKKVKNERKYEKIGVIGFCMGGAATIRLASRGLVDSAIVCHPGPCTIAEIKAISIPTSWVCAEEDEWFGPKLRAEAEAAFAAKKDKPEFVEYEFRDYKGTVHGFAARPAMSIPEVKKAFEDSVEQTIGWFEKTLTV